MVNEVINALKLENIELTYEQVDVLNEVYDIIEINRDGLENHPYYNIDLEYVFTQYIIDEREISFNELCTFITKFNIFYNEVVANIMPFTKVDDIEETKTLYTYFIDEL